MLHFKMTTPSKEIESILFKPTIDTKELEQIIGTLEFVNYGDFKDVNWLNTPGPIYTTYTDNCGTGQVEAINNVGGDEDYHEVIFKQPLTRQELKETLTAASVEPFGLYYFDGNKYWNKTNVLEWYISKIQNQTIDLRHLSVDWTKRTELDELYKMKHNDKKNSI